MCLQFVTRFAVSNVRSLSALQVMMLSSIQKASRLVGSAEKPDDSDPTKDLQTLLQLTICNVDIWSS